MRVNTKNSIYLLYFFFSIFIVLQFNSCAPKETVTIRPSRPPFPKAQPPPGYNVLIKIEQWTVIDHRILGYNPAWGKFRFAGRFDYNGELVFKFKSDGFPDHYWLIKIPSVQEGLYECRAELYQEPTPWPAVEAPKSFSVVMSIKDGRVAGHFIRNPNPGWGEFLFSRYEKGILYLRNPFYPGCEWAARMPRKDGKWTIYPTLLTNDKGN